MESGRQTDAVAELGELRAGLQAIWGMVAPGWERNADFVDERTAELSEAMLQLVDLRPGERVLELACGPGGLGLEAAEHVGPGGEAVLTDVAHQMTAIAAERARRRGLGNVTTRDLDLERINEPEDSYDAVLCREGLMLVPDPARAANEISRVLRAGGRAAISVWGPRERNPWLATMLDAAGAELGGSFPPSGVPGPFSLDSAERFRSALEGGFDEIEIREVDVPWRCESVDQWFAVTSDLAGPLAKVLEAQPSETVEAIRSRAREALSGYEGDQGLEIPGVAQVALVRAG